jgi:acylphosphatase
MKKSIRIYLKGAFQKMFFKSYIKENAEKIGVNGFMRFLEDGRVELFLEGNLEEVNKMVETIKKNPKHSNIRNIEEKKESFQGFRGFKTLQI